MGDSFAADAYRIFDAARCGVFVHVTDDDERSWAQQADWARTLPGRTHVEIWLEHLPATRASRNALIRQFASQGVLVHAPFVGLSLSSDWAALRAISTDRLREALEIAAELAADVMTIHPGPVLFATERRAALERFAQAYATLCAESGDVTVAVENMPDRRGVTREVLVSADDAAFLLTLVPDIALTLDIGHAQQNQDRGYRRFLSLVGAAVVNVHLHDAFTGGPAHLPLGSGELDLADVTQALSSLPYTGYLSLETLNQKDSEVSWQSLRTTDG